MKQLEKKKKKISNQSDISIDDLRFILQLNDGRIISCTANKRITITDLKTKQTLAVLIGHEKPITMIIQLNDSSFASCGSDAIIIIWEISKEANQRIGTLVGHREKINSIIEVKNQIISCSNDQTIRLWDYKELRCLRIIYAHRSEILSIIILKDNHLLSHTRTEIKIWDVSIFQCLTIVKISPKYIIHQLMQLLDGKIVTLFRGVDKNNLELVVWDNNIRNISVENVHLQINIKTMIQLFDGRLLGFNYLGDIVLINNETFECIKYLRKTDDIINICQFEAYNIICVSKDGISILSI